VVLLRDGRVVRGYVVSNEQDLPLVLQGLGCATISLRRLTVRRMWIAARAPGWVSPGAETPAAEGGPIHRLLEATPHP